MRYFLWVLFLFVVVWPLLRYGQYLFSNWWADSLAETRERLGGLTWPVLRGMATAAAADLLVLFTYPLGIFGGREPVEEGTPVLLVHGLYHNASAWVTVKQRLRRAGIGNLHTYQYNSFNGRFPEAVDGLQRKLDALLQATPGGKVVLVGHSLGGLVIRAAVGNPRFWGKIAGVMTLGTPHGGSDLARLAGNAMGRGLIPGAEIPATADKAPDPDCPRLAVYNLADDFVFPLKTLSPPKGWDEYICSPMAHVWMLYSREVFALIREFVEKNGKA
ncbi:alpha/beta fold hydrolase [Pseudodesulfovibrio cashew]|uniref:Alpha/beta fold hydrolase n=1 Tax=Pseudodesulfovibrio cashew TaxID=2678688 RepID=A0A6I6JMX9_9BACT|nr:alpha/beta fold hydrolase [Pseudodesulfovibrio cashew]QGY39054.1 alpha/beta fold hydrolase [Pseudodesulfovibrio cashew]